MRHLELRLALAVLVFGVCAAAAGTARADTSQTPVATACPAGFEHVTVASMEALGPYRAPRFLDTTGNANGFVCVLAFPEAARLALCGPSCPVPVLFLIGDDDIPAEMRAQVGG